MGSRSNNNYAYIAGFLDGDGSLMLQIKKRSDTKYGVRMMATICFYQDTRHEKPLIWMKKVLGVGYISRRKDGMTELRVNGFNQVKRILKLLLPHIRFKCIQAQTLIKSCEILERTTLQDLSCSKKKTLINYIWRIQQENYCSKKRTKEELLELLDLTP